MSTPEATRMEGIELAVVTPDVHGSPKNGYPFKPYTLDDQPLATLHTNEALYYQDAVTPAPPPVQPAAALTPWVVREPVWPARIKVLALFVGLLGIGLATISIFEGMWNGVIVGILAVPLGCLGYHAACKKNKQEAKIYSISFGIFTIIATVFNALVGAIFIARYDNRCEDQSTPHDQCVNSKRAFIIFWVFLMVIELAVYSACTLCGHSFHQELTLFDRRRQHAQQTLYTRERIDVPHLSSLAVTSSNQSILRSPSRPAGLNSMSLGGTPTGATNQGSHGPPPALAGTVSEAGVRGSDSKHGALVGSSSAETMTPSRPPVHPASSTSRIPPHHFTESSSAIAAELMSPPKPAKKNDMLSHADIDRIEELIRSRDTKFTGSVTTKQALGIMQEFGVVVGSKSELAQDTSGQIPVSTVRRLAQLYIGPDVTADSIPATTLLRLRREFSEADAELEGSLALEQFLGVAVTGAPSVTIAELRGFFKAHTSDANPKIGFADYGTFYLQHNT